MLGAAPAPLGGEKSMARRIGILLSGKGRGSNMKAIIDYGKEGRISGEVVVVVSTTENAPALERARNAGVPAVCVHAKQFCCDVSLGTRLVEVFREYEADLICLAGFMRKLSPQFIESYRGRIMNIHPALIPAFCGKGMYGHHVHEAVRESGVKFTGVTVHFVDEEYDHGPIIAQRVVPVLDDDTPDDIAARVLAEEHKLYSEVIQLFAEGRLVIEDRRVRVLPKG